MCCSESADKNLTTSKTCHVILFGIDASLFYLARCVPWRSKLLAAMGSSRRKKHLSLSIAKRNDFTVQWKKWRCRYLFSYVLNLSELMKKWGCASRWTYLCPCLCWWTSLALICQKCSCGQHSANQTQDCIVLEQSSCYKYLLSSSLTWCGSQMTSGTAYSFSPLRWWKGTMSLLCSRCAWEVAIHDVRCDFII